MSNLVPQWDSEFQGMADKIAKEGFASVFAEVFEKAKEAADEYKKEQEEVGNVADKIRQQVEDEQDALEYEAQKAIDMSQAEFEALQKVREQVQGLIEDYEAAKQAAIEAAQVVAEFFDKEAKVKIAAAAAPNENSGSEGDSDSDKEKDSKSKEKSSSNKTQPKEGDKVKFSGKYYNNPSGDKESGTKDKEIKVIIDDIKEGKKYPYHIKTAKKGTDLGWVKKKQLSGYDTGGYTGEWGPEGRLALLHQKELVLNADDTSNMLNIISMVRDFADSFNSSLLDKLFNLSNSVFSTIGRVGKDSELEQNVHIEATFPGVRDAKEIEDALNNLVNTASQYANRKRR